MSSSEVTVTLDNRKEWSAALRAALRVALEECGVKCEGYAQEACPVDTGRLRNSITHDVDRPNSVKIHTNVEYAAYVELGVKGRAPKPYLRPAAQNHASEWRSIIESRLK